MLPAEVTLAPPVDAATETRNTALGQEDFLRMLIAQLENQDPLDPQDATEFTAQLAQFSSLEQLISMRDAIEDLTASQTQSRGFEAVGLVGRDVLAEGSQFEIGSEGAALPRLFVELTTPAPITGIDVLDANGSVVANAPGSNPGAGLHELAWESFSRIPEPGVYSFHVKQGVASGEPAVPLVQGRVTGATVGDTAPTLFFGDAAVPLRAVREVRQ